MSGAGQDSLGQAGSRWVRYEVNNKEAGFWWIALKGVEMKQ